MGRPDFREIEIAVEYDEDGTPIAVHYCDHTGCGHEAAPIALPTGDEVINRLIEYHLDHCKSSHAMVYPAQCKATYKGLRCVLTLDEPHEEHEFRWDNSHAD